MVYTRPPYLALTYRIQVEGGMYIFVTRDETVNELNIARSFQGGTFIEGRDQSSIYSRKIVRSRPSTRYGLHASGVIECVM